MEHLFPLLDMGFTVYQLECAYAHGCKSVEEAAEFLTDGAPAVPTSSFSPTLVLGSRVPSSARSMFSPTRPFDVDLTQGTGTMADDATPKQCEPENSAEQATGSAYDTSTKNEPSLRSNAPDPEFMFCQKEAQKLAEAMRKERKARTHERKCVLAAIRADNEARRLKQLASSSAVSIAPGSGPPDQACGSTQAPSHVTNELRIKVYQSGTTAPPIVLSFAHSAVYRDLLLAIQQRVLTATLSDHDSLEGHPPIEQRVHSRHVTDACFQMILTTWPRQTLPQCTSLAIEENNTTNSVNLNRHLTELGLMDGMAVHIRHVNCPFEAHASRSTDPDEPHSAPRSEHVHPGLNRPPVVPSSPVSLFRSAISPPPEMLPDAFPGSGRQLHPRPLADQIPLISRTPQDSARRAALIRESALTAASSRSYLPTVQSQEDMKSNCWTPTSLLGMCLRRVLDIITHLTKIASSRDIDFSAPIDSHQSSNTQLYVEYWVVHTLGRVLLPEYLAQWLIKELCVQCLFNWRTATLLRNFVTRLNLDYYALVSNELIHCLALRWPDLTHLQLNGLQLGQVSVEAVSQLRFLRNLQYLTLNGVLTVCDANIGDLVDLPNLRALFIANTNVTDSGWIKAADVQSTVPRPLMDLNVSGLRGNLTNSGLEAILQLFPNLWRLNVAKSNICCKTNATGPTANFLSILNVSDTEGLESLPSCLVPLMSNSSPYSGLVDVCVANCSNLDLRALLGQLKGHPIRRIVGLETLSSLNASSLMLYCSCGFPLTELLTRQVHCPWMTESPSVLSGLLSALPVSTLVRLSLPQRPIGAPNDDEQQSLASVLRYLGRFRMLETLDLGGQVQGDSEFRAVLDALRHLERLQRVGVINLSTHFEQSLRDACPAGCAVHVQIFL